MVKVSAYIITICLCQPVFSSELSTKIVNNVALSTITLHPTTINKSALSSVTKSRSTTVILSSIREDSSDTKTEATQALSSDISRTNTGGYSTEIVNAFVTGGDTNNTTDEDDVSSLSKDASTSEDFGTVIESDLDVNTTTLDEVSTQGGNLTSKNNRKEATTEESYGNQWSMKDTLKDISYYLRAYKFNEYDRRYETNPDTAPRRYFKEFPRPPLRSLHWEVHKFCEPSFSGCVDYLRRNIRHVSLKRNDDTSVVMQEQNWTLLNNSQQIKQIDEECRKLRKLGDVVAEPFQGPLERFQWRVTASYYMCWYAMKQVPEMKHLSDHCDNFSNCLDDNLGPNNKDIRANDTRPFSCAIYSFCPDPCCPTKHLTRGEDCWDSKDNPCFTSNPPGQRECAVNRSSNIEFRDIVLNRWNVTCRCPKGREWNSRYGMCIDVDECAVGGHDCDGKLQACLNLEGTFRCACTWGHVWSSTTNKCTPSSALHLIKLAHRDIDDKEKQSESLIRKLTKFFRKSAANTLHIDNISFFCYLLCMLLCLFLK